MAGFQKVMSEYRRLCEGRRCADCPIMEKVEKAKEDYCSAWVMNHPEEAEHIIMQWAKGNPLMTNRMKFKEVFGVDCTETILCDFDGWLDQEYKGREG